MRRGETRISQGQGDIYQSRRLKIEDCFVEYFSEHDGKFVALIHPKIDNDAKWTKITKVQDFQNLKTYVDIDTVLYTDLICLRIMK
jgi:hypothetical protein